MSLALELRDAVVRRRGAALLAGVSLAVRSGEMVGLVGPNGAGKTTLVRAALGLQRLSSGEALLGGRPVRKLSMQARARHAGYLPQDRRMAWGVTGQRVASLGAPDLPQARARDVAAAALAQVGAEHLAGVSVFQMSGGERARVLLARLLATRAPLLVADEPGAGLDPQAQLSTLELLAEQARRGGAVLVTLHDLGLAARFCPRVVVLDGGRIVADGAPEAALAPAVLHRTFGLQGELISTPAGLVLAARRA